MDSAFVVGKYTLLHVELVNKKVLLYSTENFIHSPEINHNGKEYFKYIYIYICKTELLCCTAEIGSTL